MTPIDYIHNRLQQEFAEKALKIQILMDVLLDDMRRSEKLDFTDSAIEESSLEGFQILLDELLYPFLAMREAMGLSGVEDEIANPYALQLWEDMPEELLDGVSEGVTEQEAQRAAVERLGKIVANMEQWFEWKKSLLAQCCRFKTVISGVP